MDEDVRETVQMIFFLYNEEGVSIGHIADRLNQIAADRIAVGKSRGR